MQITLTRSSEIASPPAIIYLEGALNAENAVKLQRQLNSVALSNQYSSVLVNLERVEQIDSAGLMALISGFKLARRANKRFCLCSVSRPVQIILELTRLDQVLEISEVSAMDLAA
jgi:anti-sigma B factor antagonist